MVEERELNETASMSCGIPIGSHKSYAHYPQVELCDVYSDPALRLYEFKVGTTSLQGMSEN
jgi:hypothetical protein